MALVTYPLNNIEYSAEDAELFHVTRTSGIYAKDSFGYSVTGTDNNIVIGTGIGWIKNSEFSGKVVAQKEPIPLDMGLPDSVYPRIDAIVIQFDANKNETNVVVKKGTAATSPVAPSVVRTESVYELHLYHVRRDAGSIYIMPSNITDVRLNGFYCGLMVDSVTSIDTTAIENQILNLIKSLQNEISNVKDGSAYLPRDGSSPMNANLQMGGNKVTDLGAPTDDGDAIPLKYAEDHFAPAGYGYGGVIPDPIEIESDDALKAALDGLLADMPNFSARQIRVMHSGPQVVNGTAGMGRQGMLYGSLYKHSNDYAVMRVFSYTGANFQLVKLDTWGEVEWLNPPMVLGTEYRTTKRYNGKPVYIQAIDCGAAPNATGKTVNHKIPNCRPIKCYGYSSNEARTIPYRSAAGERIDIAAHATQIIVHSSYDASGVNVIAILEYWKSTD